ncbi:GDP-mannose 4,6 dehydratase [Candidatus Woesearchaeota archaeon CG10_big_fil_rev_8_21_14_0_10_44_13]|nr:MAG: GDP-mannose 4,6 dehydratase [Candidatus Woesearchaeota archaeon CG10_big_fil_rev_8_21_14_0_10_44_13]
MKAQIKTRIKALITGIDGFVGPYLAEELSDEGVEVYGTYLQEIRKPISSAKNFHLDVTDRKEALEVISEVKPDWIFHLAGFSSVAQSWKNPELCFRVNVEGTRNLLDAVIGARISPRILIVSSAEVYGKPQYLPVDEKHPLNPGNPYAKSRVEQEKVALDYVKKKGMDIVISRSFNHTGPGQLPIFVCSDFAHQIVRIEKGLQAAEINTGDLSAKRDFSDVRDMTHAYPIAIKKCISGEIYNICSGRSYSMKEILDMLISLSKSEGIVVKKDNSRLRPADIHELLGDNSKFIHATGWLAKRRFISTLEDILIFWRNN